MPEELEIEQEKSEFKEEIEINPLEQKRQQMAEQQIPVIEKNGIFFTESPVGEVPVEIPDQHETLFSQAQEIESRESEVKQQLKDSNAPVEKQIAVGKKTIKENEQAFAEAKDIQEIINQLIASGEILTVQGYDIAKNPDITKNGLHFIVSTESLKMIEEAAKKLGYSIDKIPDKGITISSSFATYTFLTEKGIKEITEEDYDYEDEYEDEQEENIKAEKKEDVKRKLDSTKKKSSNLTDSEDSPLSEISKPEKQKKYDSQSTIPSIIGSTPTHGNETISSPTKPPEQPGGEPGSSDIGSGPISPGTGIEGGGIGPIAPGAN